MVHTFAIQSDVSEALRVPEVRKRRGQIGTEAVPFQAVLLLLGIHSRAASYTCPVDKIQDVRQYAIQEE